MGLVIGSAALSRQLAEFFDAVVPVLAYEVKARVATTPISIAAERGLTPLVGRAQELERRVIEAALTYETKLREMAKWRPDSVEHFKEAAELAPK